MAAMATWLYHDVPQEVSMPSLTRHHITVAALLFTACSEGSHEEPHQFTASRDIRATHPYLQGKWTGFARRVAPPGYDQHPLEFDFTPYYGQTGLHPDLYPASVTHTDS